MKLGLDIHGVIDNNPQFFSEMIDLFMKNGHQVHIITGIKWSDKIEKKLDNMDIQYSHHFSISDHLIRSGIPQLPHSTHKNPQFHNDVWNMAKGIYCRENEITLHYDDTPIYGDHFSTPFILYKGKQNGNA